MSKVISDMLEYPERQVKKAIQSLEQKNGYPSHDVRLIAENIQKIRAKIADLQLDPDDTTAAELYHALLVKFQGDARRFNEYFGVSQKSDDEKMRKAVEIITNNTELPDRWVLKNSAAKDLIKRHPPKKLMKQWHYRSIESLLKREDTAKIYLLMSNIESPAWVKTHCRLISCLDSTAFERRYLKIVAIPDANFQVFNRGPLYNNDYGVLALLPSPVLKSTSLLSMVVSLLDRLADFEPGNTSKLAAEFSPTVAWWADMDCLIASLGSDHVSLNLKDVSDNHLLGQSLGEHALAAGQKSFWRELLSRYENKLLPEEDVLSDIIYPFRNTVPINQPAFEYVEDI